MRKLVLGASALAAGAALFAGGDARAGSNGATLSVPSQYPTIQAALDAAPRVGNVEIRIAKGTYAENVVATGFPSLSIVAEPETWIRGTSAEPALSVCMSGTVNVSGLLIESQAVGLQVLGVQRFTSTNLRVVSAVDAAVVAENSLTSGIILVGSHGERVSVQATNATFQGLTVSNAEVGVLVRANAWVTVSGSSIENVGADAIRADSGVLDVSETRIAGAPDDAIDASNASLAVSHANISGVGDAAITIGNGSGSVVRTTITDVGRVAIETREGAVCDVTGCTISDVRGDAIRVAADVVASNVVTGATRDGIVVLPTPYQQLLTAEVAWNRVEGGRTGIAVAAPNFAVTANVVAQTQGDAISVGADRVTISNNVVEDAGGNGIAAAGYNNVLIENRVDAAAGDGLDVMGEDAFVRDNVVQDAGEAGVRVAGDGAVVQGNEATRTGGDGVVVGEGWAVVSGQRVEAAGGDGVCLLGAPERPGAEVLSNVVGDCAGDGIDAGAAVRARIERNQVTGAGACGIRLGDGSRGNRLARNVVKGSGDADLWEDDGAGRNVVKRNNRFATRHRRARR